MDSTLKTRQDTINRIADLAKPEGMIDEDGEKTASARRPDIATASATIEAWLDEHVPGYPTYTLCEDGDDDSAENKCGWAFWIADMDTTSYLHEDLTIEWCGTMWPDDYHFDEETGTWSEVPLEPNTID